MSAVCPHCRQEMTPGTSCTSNPDGNRIPWGSETLMTEMEALATAWREQPWNCHDCNAAPGGLHHPGCDTEECPYCHQQALACTHY